MQSYIIRRSDDSENDTYKVLWSGLVDAEDGLPTGFGRLIHLETKQVYEGHCSRGLRHGQGRNVWTDNEQYIRGNGSIINERDEEHTPGPMDVPSLVVGKRGTCMVVYSFHGPMVPPMMVTP